jgi:hypothetical protein
MKSTPVRGVKQHLKPDTYKLSEPYVRKDTGDGVPFIMDRRVDVRGKVKGLRSESEAKASAKCANQVTRIRREGR